MRAVLAAVLIVFLAGAGPAGAVSPQDDILPPAGAPQQVPFAFIVPVAITNLHPNLTLVRVRCWVFPRDDWKTDGGALGEGVSRPLATGLEGGVRELTGEVDVAVPLRDPRLDPASARSYRCQIELYDQSSRQWADMKRVDAVYPMDRESRSVTETGGILGR